jgi:hypothetical protein
MWSLAGWHYSGWTDGCLVADCQTNRVFGPSEGVCGGPVEGPEPHPSLAAKPPGSSCHGTPTRDKWVRLWSHTLQNSWHKTNSFYLC